MIGWMAFTVSFLWTGMAAGQALRYDRAFIEGVVVDDDGRAVVGADVVATACEDSARQVAVTEGRGQFSLQVDAPALLDLVVIKRQGSEVLAAVLRVEPGERMMLRVQGSVVKLGHHARALGSPGASVRRDGVPLIADATVGGYVENTVGGTAGMGAGEIVVTLDGLRLDDPIDGRAPWNLPLGLFGSVALSDAVTGTSRAEMRLSSAASEPHSSAVAVASQRAGGFLLTGVAGRCAAALTIRAGVSTIDPRGGNASWEGPILARGHAEVGQWRIAGVGLVERGQTRFGQRSPIEPARQVAVLAHGLMLATVEARRGWSGSSAEFSAAAGHVRGTREVQTRQGGAPLKTQSDRSHAEVGVSTQGQAVGRHWLRLAMGVDVTLGRWNTREDRPGLVPRVDEPMRGQGYEWAAGLDERWRMLDFAELDVGVRAEKRWLRNRTEGGGIETEPLLAPRVRLRAWHAASGLEASLRAARFSGAAPLSWMQPGDTPGDVMVSAPVEDLLAAETSWQADPLRLVIQGVSSRSSHLLQDRLDLAVQRRIIENQNDVVRVYRGLRFQAEARWAGLRVGGVYSLSRLRGTYAGPRQMTANDLRPEAPFHTNPDRTHDLRTWAVAAKQVRGFQLRAGLVGRLQGGASGTLDCGAGIAKALGSTVIWGALEGFNLTGARVGVTSPISVRLVAGIDL